VSDLTVDELELCLAAFDAWRHEYDWGQDWSDVEDVESKIRAIIRESTER
jgi:hypothetical protein